jgi:hypothetical protein
MDIQRLQKLAGIVTEAVHKCACGCPKGKCKCGPGCKCGCQDVKEEYEQELDTEAPDVDMDGAEGGDDAEMDAGMDDEAGQDQSIRSIIKQGLAKLSQHDEGEGEDAIIDGMVAEITDLFVDAPADDVDEPSQDDIEEPVDEPTDDPVA